MIPSLQKKRTPGYYCEAHIHTTTKNSLYKCETSFFRSFCVFAVHFCIQNGWVAFVTMCVKYAPLMLFPHVMLVVLLFIRFFSSGVSSAHLAVWLLLLLYFFSTLLLHIIILQCIECILWLIYKSMCLYVGLTVSSLLHSTISYLNHFMSNTRIENL